METFLQDCSADIGAEASTHLAKQSRSVTQQSVQSAAWQEVPSTCLVCTQGRDTPVQAQREFARRAGAVVELDAGHHPFLSQLSVGGGRSPDGPCCDRLRHNRGAAHGGLRGLQTRRTSMDCWLW